MGTGTSDPTPLLEEVGTPTSGNPRILRKGSQEKQLYYETMWGLFPTFFHFSFYIKTRAMANHPS